MEKHRCKLCDRRFSNGRALGGHMRSHMMKLPTSPKPEPSPSQETESLTESPSPSSTNSEEDNEEEDEGVIDKGPLYKLRDNPRKSIKLADLEDRESEAEAESTRNPTRRRSLLRRKNPPPSWTNMKNSVDVSDCNEAEPVSSMSEVTSEEGLALCLMMLSRDKWAGQGRDFGDDDNDNVNVTEKNNGNNNNNSHGKYRCMTCNKLFMSYQALGGHRASHKKIRVAANAESDTLHQDNNDNNNNNIDISYESITEVNGNQQKKVHECPVCFKVFASGQALGGHKRSHAIGDIENYNQKVSDVQVQSPKKIKSENTTLIDLNLPAPADDDEEETSQIAVSAVSDAHL